jgi:hypothetical protein
MDALRSPAEGHRRRTARLVFLFAALALVLLGFARWAARKAPATAEERGADLETVPPAAPERAPLQMPVPAAGPPAPSPASPPRDGSSPATPVAILKDCPPTAPVAGGPCHLEPSSEMSCRYGEGPKEIVCECDNSSGSGSTPSWQCGPPKGAQLAQCPPQKPDDKSGCSPASLTCFYGKGGVSSPVCVCKGETNPRWSCMTFAKWHDE